MSDLLKMNEKDFTETMKNKTERIESILKEYIPSESSYQKTIIEAMEYSVMGGGKRLRPMMLWEAYSLAGGTEEKVAAPFMAAIEMIHTYSLVHDDLPAMDNDEYRRGRKTTHVVYGEDMGILTGDALLNYAYETAANAIMSMEDIKSGVKALQILSGKSGVYGMVGGQVVDVEKTGSQVSEDELEYIYLNKTSALIEASLMAGAALAGADSDMINDMEKVGRYVGMAFQIQDDILDITSTTSELGKPVHSDEKNEKCTYVTIYGMDKAVKAVEEYSEKALDILAGMSAQNEYLNSLIEMLVRRKK